MSLVLFDIDGTLLRSGGAGRKAMDLAFEGLFGVAGAFDAIDFRGALDDLVLSAVFAAQGLADTEASRRAFKEAFVLRLRATMDPWSNPELRLCPGVHAVLDALEPMASVALVTGNWQVGARGKLDTFGLWERFPFGAFSEDGGSRAELIRVAVARARGRGLSAERAVMIGDTPADVAAAREAGVLAVAVRTGWSEPASLVAAEPDLLLPDLEVGLPALLALVQSGKGVNRA
ncbi:MAG: HAD hydrolase-like protein [Pseudomonadota bacterium]